MLAAFFNIENDYSFLYERFENAFWKRDREKVKK